MNRIEEIGRGAENYSVFEQRMRSPGTLATTPNYDFFTPLHYERNYAYPLLDWLHGERLCERQLRVVMPQISPRNYVGAAPRGTVTLPDEEAAYRWVQSETHIERAADAVARCLAMAESRYRINPRRIFLAGSGCGGTMALRLALRRPDRVAGVLSLGGRLPRGRTPLAALRKARCVPVMLACGSCDPDYPTERFCADLRLLHSAGADVTLRHYSCQRPLAAEMLADVNRWIMEVLARDASHAVVSEDTRRV